MLLIRLIIFGFGGGERGIRTPGTRKRTIDFESTAFDHSAISPRQWDFIKVVPERGRS